jgi:rhamnopyranosyl-N-acetylglucosaminyl-diphospho-decaprenol beta-1,3/1,4-galactofuranosyltransferase
MNQEKTAAVVVTYNRKELLVECLVSLLKQSYSLDAVYIIDNDSTDGTLDYLLSKDLVCPPVGLKGEPSETVKAVASMALPDSPIEIHYVRMPENTGGAGGFHEGMKRAVAAGFDWLWLMDDDLWTAPDALAALVRKKDALRGEPVLLNSLVLARDQADGDTLAFPLQELTARGYPRRGIYHWRLSEVQAQVRDGLYRWACPFNGTFLPARVVAEVGLPNKEFFIWGDERDFLWRAAKRFDPYTVIDSRVFHPPSREATFDWKQYYGIRNAILVNRHFRWTAVRNLKLTLSSLAGGARHGRSGLTLVLRAIGDGWAGRLGKRDDLHP